MTLVCVPRSLALPGAHARLTQLPLPEERLVDLNEERGLLAVVDELSLVLKDRSAHSVERRALDAQRVVAVVVRVLGNL